MDYAPGDATMHDTKALGLWKVSDPVLGGMVTVIGLGVGGEAKNLGYPTVLRARV